MAAIDEDYEMGLMSQEERHKQVVDIWNCLLYTSASLMSGEFILQKTQ